MKRLGRQLCVLAVCFSVILDEFVGDSIGIVEVWANLFEFGVLLSVPGQNIVYGFFGFDSGSQIFSAGKGIEEAYEF